MTKPYGKQFINSIPEVPLLHDKKHQLFKDAKTGCYITTTKANDNT